MGVSEAASAFWLLQCLAGQGVRPVGVRSAVCGWAADLGKVHHAALVAWSDTMLQDGLERGQHSLYGAPCGLVQMPVYCVYCVSVICGAATFVPPLPINPCWGVCTSEFVLIHLAEKVTRTSRVMV